MTRGDGGQNLLGDEKGEREKKHQGAGDVDREVGKRHDREHARDSADHAGQDGSGRRELGDDAVGGQQQQQRRDRGIDERPQEHLPERHRVVFDDRPGGVDRERAVLARYGPTVGRRQERVDVGGLEVGDVQPDGVLGVDVDAVADGVLSPVCIPAMDLGEAAHASDGVVQHLRHEGIFAKGNCLMIVFLLGVNNLARVAEDQRQLDVID